MPKCVRKRTVHRDALLLVLLKYNEAHGKLFHWNFFTSSLKHDMCLGVHF